jgi:hypothetical protein
LRVRDDVEDWRGKNAVLRKRPAQFYGKEKERRRTERESFSQLSVLHALRNAPELFEQIGRDLLVVELVEEDVELRRDPRKLLSNLRLKDTSWEKRSLG